MHPAPEASAAARVPKSSSDASHAFPPAAAIDEKKSARSGPSFSEISQLPPLKEAYVAPPEPRQAEIPAPAAAPGAGRPVAKPESRPRIQPKQAAQRAVTQIKKTPSRLFAYSIAGAVGL